MLSKLAKPSLRARLLASVMLICACAGLYQPVQAAIERYGYDPLGRLIQFVDSSNQVTEYSYDAAGNLTTVTGGGAAAAYLPVLTSVTPNFVRRGDVKSIVITGQRLQAGSLQTSDTGLDLLNVRQTATQIQTDLSVGANVPLGTQTLTFNNAEGSASLGITVAPVLPVLSAEPSPLALPPDNTAHTITLRLSTADVIAHVVNLAFTDTSKATISPASVTLTSGQTSVLVSVTSKLAGFTTLQLTSPTLQPVSVPVYITADFRGINTSNAAPVGVMVGTGLPAASNTAQAMFSSPRVGIAVGAVLTDMSPKGLPVGATQNLVVSGKGIPVGAVLSLIPSAGVAVGSSSVAFDGSQISAALVVDSAAAVGARRVVVKDASGKVLPFTDAGASQLVLTTGQPTVQSIDPLFATAGSLMQLKVRGSNLQNARMTILPATDMAIDTQPVVNASGTELTVNVQIYALAATGARVVQITTPSGQSSAAPNEANQFTIVSQIKNNITPIFAQPVGVMVGSAAVAPVSQTVAPIAAPALGVVVGAAAQTLTPKVAVVGTSINLVVAGTGLQAVQSVGFVTADGLTPSAFTVNGDGTVLTVPVSVDAAAAKTMRRIVLNTATGRLPFVRDSEAAFLVAAPTPELISTTPQVIKAGTSTTLTVLGKNFRDVAGVRFEPANGLSAAAGIVASPDGTVLTVPVSATSGATTGPRTLIVMTAGGESTNVSLPANTVQVAQQVGPTYAAISAQPVGIVVGNSTPIPVSNTLNVVAPLVGVLVQSNPVAVTDNRLIAASHVGVVVGTAATSLTPASPDGFLIASSGQFTITGYGLDKVTGIAAVGTTGVSFGALSANAQGTQLTVPVTVAGSTVAGRYGVALTQTQNAVVSKVTVVPAAPLMFSTGALPTQIDSMTPIVMEQGKAYTFTVRGVGLKDVYQLVAEPDAAASVFGTRAVQWSTDALGEKLTVSVQIDPSVSVGSRVVRLRVPGGMTDATSVPANTITIVPPQ